jgi:allophanate hydrolase
MSATIDGVPVVWNASHSLNPGQKLRIGGALEGTYGYLSFAGGIATLAWLGSRAAHLTAGIGKALEAGDTLPLNADPSPEMAPCIASVLRRYHGGIVRVMPGPQTHLFDQDTRDRFAATEFTRSAKANRQGVALDQSGAPFSAENARTILSDFIVPGDVQMTGDGTPYILMSECQTIGGYPRIGTVLPLDMPIAAQAPVGAPIRFEWITEDEAAGLYQSEDAILAQVRAKVRPLFRNPADIHDLLSYQLISGMTRGDELERAD